MAGDEEAVYDKAGNCTSVRRKRCSKSILDYLRENSPNYQTGNRRGNGDADEQEAEDVMPVWEIKSFAEPDDNKEPAKPV